MGIVAKGLPVCGRVLSVWCGDDFGATGNGAHGVRGCFGTHRGCVSVCFVCGVGDGDCRRFSVST